MRELTLIETQAPIDCCAPLGASTLSDEEVEAMAALFAALADPARVRIVNLVATSDEPVCACHLIEPLGLSQPTVSHHLKRLVEAGLLEREQRGGEDDDRPFTHCNHLGSTSPWKYLRFTS